MVKAAIACLLAFAAVASAQPPPATPASPPPASPPGPERALAAELLAQPDAAARDRWLDEHRDRLTAPLGREVNAQAAVLQKAGRYDDAFAAFALAVRIGEAANDVQTRVTGLRGQGDIERQRGRVREALLFLERGMA